MPRRRPRSAGVIAQRQKLDRAIATLERHAAAAYRATWASAGAAPSAAALEQAIRQGAAAAANLLVPDGLTEKVASEVLDAGARKGAKMEAAFITSSAGAAKLKGPAREIVAVTPVPPRAAKWASKHSAALVKEVDASTRKAIRDLVSDGIKRGEHVRSVAKSLRGKVGIHPRNVPPIERVAESMRAGGASEAKIAKVVAHRTRKAIEYRANVIARTETVASVSKGRESLWQELDRRKHLRGEQVTKEWMTAYDERVCPLCGPVEGMTVQGLTTPFPGGDAPPRHAACRCEILFTYEDR